MIFHFTILSTFIYTSHVNYSTYQLSKRLYSIFKNTYSDIEFHDAFYTIFNEYFKDDNLSLIQQYYIVYNNVLSINESNLEYLKIILPTEDNISFDERVYKLFHEVRGALHYIDFKIESINDLNLMMDIYSRDKPKVEQVESVSDVLYNLWKPISPKPVFESAFHAIFSNLFRFAHSSKVSSQIEDMLGHMEYYMPVPYNRDVSLAFCRQLFILLDVVDVDVRVVKIATYMELVEDKLRNSLDKLKEENNSPAIIAGNANNFYEESKNIPQMMTTLDHPALTLPSPQDLDNKIHVLNNLYPWLNLCLETSPRFTCFIKIIGTISFLENIPEIHSLLEELTGVINIDFIQGQLYLLNLIRQYILSDIHEVNIHLPEKNNRPNAKIIRRAYSNSIYNALVYVSDEKDLPETKEEYFELFEKVFSQFNDDSLNALEIGLQMDKFLSGIVSRSGPHSISSKFHVGEKDITNLVSTWSNTSFLYQVSYLREVIKSAFERNMLQTTAFESFYSNVRNIEFQANSDYVFFGGFDNDKSYIVNLSNFLTKIYKLKTVFNSYDISGERQTFRANANANTMSKLYQLTRDISDFINKLESNAILPNSHEYNECQEILRTIFGYSSASVDIKDLLKKIQLIIYKIQVDLADVMVLNQINEIVLKPPMVTK